MTLDRHLLMTRLKGNIDALAYRHSHTEIVRATKPDGTPYTYRHITRHAPLVEQLVMRPKDAEAPADGGGRGVYESSPPSHLHAIDRHRAIEAECLEWLRRMRIPPRPVLTKCLSALVGGANRLDVEALAELVDASRSWWRWARTITGWDDPPYAPWGPCPVCRRVGSIRARATPKTAVCVECWASWDSSGVDELGRYFRMWAETQETVGRGP
jgi:hypothetical protein